VDAFRSGRALRVVDRLTQSASSVPERDRIGFGRRATRERRRERARLRGAPRLHRVLRARPSLRLRLPRWQECRPVSPAVLAGDATAGTAKPSALDVEAVAADVARYIRTLRQCATRMNNWRK
jgi:hypothetical protein